MALSSAERVALESIRAATVILTGEAPSVIEEGGKTVVSFDAEQQRILTRVIEGWLSGPEGNLKVRWWPILFPIFVKRAARVAAVGGGAAVLSYFLIRGKHGK